MAIKVYVANIKNKTFEQLLCEYQNYLKEEDILKASRFKVDLNKRQTLMSAILKHKFVQGNITYSDSGKPLSDACFFNVSHSADLVVLAINQNYPIGVDIEFINNNISDELISYVCADEELEFLNDDKYQKFYYLWTRKEAILKCEGIGLVHDLKAINALDKNGPFQLYSISLDQYVLSLAIKGQINKCDIQVIWK